jgi:hypothetical protein
MTNEVKNNPTTISETKNQGKRQLSLPKVVTGLRAGQSSLAQAMPPGGM